MSNVGFMLTNGILFLFTKKRACDFLSLNNIASKIQGLQNLKIQLATQFLLLVQLPPIRHTVVINKPLITSVRFIFMVFINNIVNFDSPSPQSLYISKWHYK